MSGPAAIGGFNLNATQGLLEDNGVDTAALEQLRDMVAELEEKGYSLPSNLSEFLEDPQGFLQQLVEDLEDVDLAQFAAVWNGASMPTLSPNETAELIADIEGGALEPKPGSSTYIQARNEVDEFMGTVKEGREASGNALEALPINSLTRQFVDPLNDAIDAQELKVEELLKELDGYNVRVKEGLDAKNSGDPEKMKQYLLKYDSELTAEELADKTVEELTEMVQDDIEHVGQLSETAQIHLQAGMAELQVLYSTLSAIVAALADATKGAASRIGS